MKQVILFTIRMWLLFIVILLIHLIILGLSLIPIFILFYFNDSELLLWLVSFLVSFPVALFLFFIYKEKEIFKKFFDKIM